MLTQKQVSDFVRDGYCTVDLPLQDEWVEQAKALVWDFCPPWFEPDDQSTWTGVVQDSCDTRTMTGRVGRLKYRECARSFRSARVLAMWNKDLQACIQTLITPAVKPSGYRFMPIFRGLYPIFSQPAEDCIERAHCDTHCFQVGSVTYLNDVGETGGAFVVWPGSHRLIAPYARTLSHSNTPEQFEAACDTIQNSIDPVHVTGRTGTVILWHHRLLHAAGGNRTRDVRHAMLCDFKNNLADARAKDRGPHAFDDTWAPGVQELNREFGQAMA